MSRTPLILLAAVSGATAGFVVHQKQRAEPAPDGTRQGVVVVAAPPGNIAAAAVAGMMLRSPVAAFAAGFSISAVGGTRLDEMVGEWLRQARSQAR